MQNLEATVEKGVTLFSEGLNCAQSSFAALCELWGLEGDPRVAACFGGGIGRTGGPCGLITGSLMALGLLAGTNDPKDQATKERVTALARDAFYAFKNIGGATGCNDLTGVDHSTQEGRAEFTSRGGKQTICIPLMRSTLVMMDGLAKKEGLVKS